MKIRNSRFYFARHCMTGKAEHDIDRCLNEEGIRQAEKLGTLLPREFDTVVITPAIRTLQTAEIITEGVHREILQVDELYRFGDTASQEAMEKIAEQLGNQSLGRYYSHPDSAIFYRFGENSADAFMRDMGGSIENKCVLVVSHAVLINLLICFLFPNSPTVRGFALEEKFECGEATEIIVGEPGEDVRLRLIKP